MSKPSDNQLENFEPEMDRFLNYYRSVQEYLKAQPLVKEDDQTFTPHLCKLSSRQLQLLLKDVSLEVIRRNEGLLTMYLKTDHFINNEIFGKRYISDIDAVSFRILASNLLYVFKTKYPNLMDSIDRFDPNITVLSASFNQDGEFANDISPNILSKKVPEYEKVNNKSSDDTLNYAFDKLLDNDNSNENILKSQMDAIAYSEAQIRVAYKRVKELENLLKKVTGIQNSQVEDKNEILSLVQQNQALKEENEKLKNNEDELKQKVLKLETELKFAKSTQIKEAISQPPPQAVNNVKEFKPIIVNEKPKMSNIVIQQAEVDLDAKDDEYFSITKSELNNLKSCLNELSYAAKSQKSTQIVSITQKVIIAYYPLLKQLGEIQESNTIHTAEEVKKLSNLRSSITKIIKLIISCSKSYSTNPDPSLIYQFESLAESLKDYTDQLEKLSASQPAHLGSKAIQFTQCNKPDPIKVNVSDMSISSDEDRYPETPVTGSLESSSIYNLNGLVYAPVSTQNVYSI
ncbi:hypothetical protein CONCODRAFT_16506 [Conidiobolus coronatus NRRL 28638]|uniref:GIT Spa2 homology (SHD) domain-containing protein n=1 Tax=Conidiobolus coronatus (strain ATCC 28846 / CBS 209.66 / NRRL 28638) TaxID=796925 RepID=A0A137PAG2_CONC2|nr:hypothetical protein CONCODRAFT_16506 [Conidiobolus coronatus NRRL 28638]|eukprot:KXN72009.1 hypothetical protein CONCODRAFT_16506 [Conidiobolus coronatus NRRL 28638]